MTRSLSHAHRTRCTPDLGNDQNRVCGAEIVNQLQTMPQRSQTINIPRYARRGADLQKSGPEFMWVSEGVDALSPTRSDIHAPIRCQGVNCVQRYLASSDQAQPLACFDAKSSASAHTWRPTLPSRTSGYLTAALRGSASVGRQRNIPGCLPLTSQPEGDR